MCKKKADVLDNDGLTPYCFSCWMGDKLNINGGNKWKEQKKDSMI